MLHVIVLYRPHQALHQLTVTLSMLHIIVLYIPHQALHHLPCPCSNLETHRDGVVSASLDSWVICCEGYHKGIKLAAVQHALYYSKLFCVCTHEALVAPAMATSLPCTQPIPGCMKRQLQQVGLRTCCTVRRSLCYWL